MQQGVKAESADLPAMSSARGSRNWPAISATIGAAGIIVAISLRLLERDVTALEIAVLTNSPVVEVKDSVDGKIELHYEGKLVANVYLLDVMIRNSGNRPILPADFVQPIRFTFPEPSEIAQLSVLDQSPRSVQLTPTIGKRDVTILPALLNPGDAVTFRMLVANLAVNATQSPFTIGGRIVGVKEFGITEHNSTQASADNRISLSTTAVITTLSALIGMIFSLRVFRPVVVYR